jgi:ketosteroid isomerase-like protein
MKKLIYSVILCTVFCIFGTSLSAQAKPPKLPMDNKASVEKFLKQIYDAFEKQDFKTLKGLYDGRAGEISPDGSMVQGLKPLEASWKAFHSMVDPKPSFNYQLTSSRMVDNDIAIITWSEDDDIKIKGKQIGGKMIGMAVLKKKNDSWIIQFDALTPVMAMPAAPPMPAEKKMDMPADTAGGK